MLLPLMATPHPPKIPQSQRGGGGEGAKRVNCLRAAGAAMPNFHCEPPYIEANKLSFFSLRLFS